MKMSPTTSGIDPQRIIPKTTPAHKVFSSNWFFAWSWAQSMGGNGYGAGATDMILRATASPDRRVTGRRPTTPRRRGNAAQLFEGWFAPGFPNASAGAPPCAGPWI